MMRYLISHYDEILNIALDFVYDKSNVWTSQYDLSYALPWKLSKIFYADYGANADRYYILPSNDWSRTIEGTHAIYCALFSLMDLIFKTKKILINI